MAYWDVPGLRVVDFVTYGPQTNDDSQGRLPNGTGPLTFFGTPTPGASNQAAASAAAETMGLHASLIDEFFALTVDKSRTHKTALPLESGSARQSDDILLPALRSQEGESASESLEASGTDQASLKASSDAALAELLELLELKELVRNSF